MYAIEIVTHHAGSHIVKRATIIADDALLAKVKQASARENKSGAQFMREALQSGVGKQQPATSRFSFTGQYKSSRSDVAERHEKRLWSDQK